MDNIHEQHYSFVSRNPQANTTVWGINRQSDVRACDIMQGEVKGHLMEEGKQVLVNAGEACKTIWNARSYFADIKPG